MASLDSIRFTISSKSTSELEREFSVYRASQTRSSNDKIYQELIAQELDLREREYDDWENTFNNNLLKDNS